MPLKLHSHQRELPDVFSPPMISFFEKFESRLEIAPQFLEEVASMEQIFYSFYAQGDMTPCLTAWRPIHTAFGSFWVRPYVRAMLIA